MKKKTKRKIVSFFIILIFFIVSFFFDNDFFFKLKNTVLKDINLSQNSFDKIANDFDVISLDDDLVVFFLDVGQADSILIKSQNEFMLIDAGNNADGIKLVNYFKSLGIKEFKYLIGTHAHEDHIGGMDDIINNFKVKNFYMPDDVTTTRTFYDVLDALESKSIAFKVPEIGTTLKLGNSDVNVIYVGSNKEDLNDTSIVIKLIYKDISFLFTGDATSNVEREIINSDIKSNVLKVGHHGSKYSSSAVFLNKVKPEYAIISCAEINDYGHPHEVVINKLNKLGAQIFETSKLGTIVAISDGKKITFKNIETNTDGG